MKEIKIERRRRQKNYKRGWLKKKMDNIKSEQSNSFNFEANFE